jgi:hypothetical protein
MRTTLTLDEDVAALLRRVQEASKATLKEVVNEALRQGQRQMVEPPPLRSHYPTRSVDLGRCRLGSIDEVTEVLARSERETHR